MPKKLKYPLIIKNRYGTFYCGKNVYSGWCATSIYEPSTLKKISLDEGDFIDLGAHIGKYSIKIGRENKLKRVSSKAPRYISLRKGFDF